MQTEKKSRHIGRKTWYSVAIGLSVVVIMISIAAIIGAWWLQSALGPTIVNLLAAVEKSAAGGRLLIERLDQGLEEIQGLTAGISDASQQLSQNVTDKGLVLTLLPEEREDQLVERVTSLAESIQSVVDVARSALEMYRAIDSIPFVSLPKPDEEAVAKLEQTISGIQSAAQELAQGVKDFRNGVTAAIGRVTEAAERIDARLGEARQNLTKLDASLAALQQIAADLQERLPSLFMLTALFTTLFLAYVIYTQVELIRTLAGRWRALNAPAAKLPTPPAEPQMKVFEAEAAPPEVIEKGEEEEASGREVTPN
jgi:hypothetical protein